ncbi:MAG: NAD(P)H-hydrate dehydratase [Minisyncoccia bacterium]
MNLRRVYKKRDKWSHKGDFGKVLIVSGSKIYSGSPVFNAISAFRAGADLVAVVGHKRAMDIAAGSLPDIITYPLEFDLNLYHATEIAEIAKEYDAMIIGCGLKRSDDTHRAIREIIEKINLPMVIDAEGIRAISHNLNLVKGKNVVITPHAEEFRVLTGETVKPEIKDRQEKVRKWAEKIGATIILKGNVDVISDGNKTVLSRAGTPFMTKGGFGDTLSGICGALLARGVKSLEAAEAAAYINGKAGELASKRYGESVLASDIFEFIPKVIKKYNQ